jgi:phenazine biosynthesis protein PhzF family
MKIKIYQADAFTTEPFGGNPAGVVPDATGITEEYMQKIAREMNLSETAFIIPIDNDNFKVRFFTPVSEVDLCGHATIASFYTLANKGYISPIDNGVKTVYQETNAGKLKVDIYYKDGTVDKVMMQQAIPEDLEK